MAIHFMSAINPSDQNSIFSRSAVCSASPNKLVKRLNELVLELERLGDKTPPPSCYPYDQIRQEGSIYKLYTKDGENYTVIPLKLAADSSAEEHSSHRALIEHLEHYFYIKDAIEVTRQSLKSK